MMNHFDVFQEAAGQFASPDDAVGYLNSAKKRYGVSNLSYWFLGDRSEQGARPTWLSTYDQRYVALYMRDIKPTTDPIFEIGFARQLPLDWSEFHGFSATTESMEEMAERYGISRQGISFPITDVQGRGAMFSVNFACTDEEWLEVRGELVSIFHLFGHYFHLRARELVNASRRNTERAVLSPRERDVLLWAAEGKTSWEAAKLLGISHSAARLYMSNAMLKLKATSKTQAVAVALRGEFIN
jgi:DNA-binding CsgD family transcriptional regulator